MNLLAFYRSLTRHKLYAALNIGGLAVGIAVFIVLGLYVRFETSYEHWLPGWRGIYLVETHWTMPDSPITGTFPDTMGGLLDQMREDFPGLQGTRIWPTGADVIRGGIGTAEDLVQVDASFFDIFALPLVRGNAKGTLADPSNVLIDQTIARKYFPGQDALGRAMRLNVQGKTAIYRVAGVFADLPKATELPSIAMIVRMPAVVPEVYWYHWGSSSLFTFLRFADPAQANAFAAHLDNFADRRGRKDLGPHASRTESLTLLPAADYHLANTATRLTVTTLGLVGLLTLAIAIVNYVNLATARAGLRAREVAMRKVLGADRATLIRQFVIEAIATVAVAALIGLAIAEIGLPLVNAAGGLPLGLAYLGRDGVLLPAIVLVGVVGLGAGFYPAFLLSRFPAAAVLASARAPGGGRAGTRVREALVVFQFSLAIAFIIGTMILVAQTRHVRHSDLGFDRAGLVEVQSLNNPALSDAQRQTLLDAFRALPMVRATGVADTAVGDDSNNNDNNVPIPGVPGDGPSLKYVVTGPDFFRAYGIHPIAGRLFDVAHGLDDSLRLKYKDPRNIVINARAVSTLGFRSPTAAIGKTVGGRAPRTIVGVIPDLRFYSPHKAVASTYYGYTSGMPSMAAFASVRFVGDPHAAIDALRTAWRRIAPEVPFNAKLATSSLDTYYADDDHAASLFTIGAVLAVAIGCVGLWGLASFNTARRTREIGIRKTLGASSADVVTLLVGQFLRPVLIANLFAWPLAFVAMRTWLAGFDDRIALSPLYFVAATLLALVIAIGTVIAQSLRAARATPAWALRHE